MMQIGSSSTTSKGKRPIYWENHDTLQNALPGSLLERWGYIMEIDDDVVRPDTFERQWRHRGDPKADAVVKRLKIGNGEDALGSIEDYLSRVPSHLIDPAVKAFWEEVSGPPPEAVSAHRCDGKGRAVWTPKDAIESDNRHPQACLDEGQALFARYAIELASALLSFSLAAGFSAPRLKATLQETGYLTSSNRDVAYRRLLETNQFVIDAMRDMEPLRGKGWRSAIRVRLLHAQVRLRIEEGKGRLGLYDTSQDGIPINQEDLAATLGGFCVGPIWACRRLGVGLTEEEEFAYVAAWRHIGFYMGVEVGILERHFTRLSAAEKFLASSAWHLFADEMNSSEVDPYSTTTMRILEAVTSRPPQASSLLHHVEMARRMLGPGLAARLALPRVPLTVRLQVRYKLLLIRCFTLFGRYYRKNWNVRRARLMQRVMVAITAWQLGKRRTKFVAKGPECKDADPANTADFEELDIQLGEQAGREIAGQYRALVREMLLVVGVLVVAIGLILLRAFLSMVRFVPKQSVMHVVQQHV